MLSVFQTTFPPPNTPIVDSKGNMSNDGMAFLRALFGRTGQGTGLVNQVTTGIGALGTTAATAYQITTDWNDVTTIVLGSSSVIIPQLTGGQLVVVFNSDTVSNLTVFPPTGAKIDGGNSYSIPSTKMQIFWFISATKIVSTQLG